MARHLDVLLGHGRRLRVVHTGRDDGDFQIDSDPDLLDANRRRLVDLPWTWLRQVHGVDVVTVNRPGAGAGCRADAALTTVPGCALAVTTADCAPVVLAAERGFAVIHAGWRGLVAGVIERAATELADRAGPPVATVLGPCILPAGYEFGLEDLDEITDALGPTVRSHTASGRPALDVPAAVAVACRRAGWPEPALPPPCTSGPGYFSHRTRGDTGRQATVAWMPVHDTDPGS